MIKKKQRQKGALLFDLMTELCLGKVLHGRTGMGGKHVCLQKSVLGCRQSTAALWTKPSYAAWGGNLTFWGRSWGLGQAQVSCQRQELWCSRIHRDVYLYFPVPASITLLKPVVTLTPGILLLAEKTFHFTALCKITFKPGMAKIISNERLRKIIQCRT